MYIVGLLAQDAVRTSVLSMLHVNCKENKIESDLFFGFVLD